MSEQPTSLPFDVIEKIAPIARAVAEANQSMEGSDHSYYFHLEVRAPGDGRVAEIDGDDPYKMFRFGWDPEQGEEL